MLQGRQDLREEQVPATPLPRWVWIGKANEHINSTCNISWMWPGSILALPLALLSSEAKLAVAVLEQPTAPLLLMCVCWYMAIQIIQLFPCSSGMQSATLLWVHSANSNPRAVTYPAPFAGHFETLNCCHKDVRHWYTVKTASLQTSLCIVSCRQLLNRSLQSLFVVSDSAQHLVASASVLLWTVFEEGKNTVMFFLSSVL